MQTSQATASESPGVSLAQSREIDWLEPVDAYAALSPAERTDLLAFLESL